MDNYKILEGVDERALRDYLKIVDGRTYWKASKFLEMDFSEEFVNSVTRDHVADPENPKSRIFDCDKAAIDAEGFLESMIDPNSERYTKEHLVAVADLDFLSSIASHLGIQCDQFHGSGSQAHEYATRIIAYLDGEEQAPLRVTDSDRIKVVSEAILRERLQEKKYAGYTIFASHGECEFTIEYTDDLEISEESSITISYAEFNAKAHELGSELSITRMGRTIHLEIEGPHGMAFVQERNWEPCDVCDSINNEESNIEFRMRYGHGERERMVRVVFCEKCLPRAMFHDSYGFNMIVAEHWENGTESMVRMINSV